MDTDGDGILSSYELAQFWQEQEARYDITFIVTSTRKQENKLYSHKIHKKK